MNIRKWILWCFAVALMIDTTIVAAVATRAAVEVLSYIADNPEIVRESVHDHNH